MSAPPAAPEKVLGPREGLLLVVLLGLIWGSAYPVIRFGIVSGASPILFADVRYALTAVAMLAAAVASRVPRPSGHALLMSALLGLPIVGIYGGLLYIGEQTTSGGLSSILIAFTPLLTALFALPVLPQERLAPLGFLGLAVGFVGVFVLVAPPPGVTLASSIWGPIAVVGAAASFAAGSVALRASRPEGETLWGVTLQFASATALLAILVPVLEPHAAFPTNSNVLGSLAYLVAMPSVAGYILYFYLHHHVGPGQANVVAYVNPVAALSIGTLLFGESFVWWEVVGFGLVVVGLTLLTASRRRGSAPSPGGEPPSAAPPGGEGG